MYRVKICGLVDPGDAAAALRFGADALGVLVGVRHRAEDALEPEDAEDLIRALPAGTPWVLVTHLSNGDEVADLLDRLGCRAVQLQDSIPPSEVGKIRIRFPGILILKALFVTDGGPDPVLRQAERYLPVAGGFVLDSLSPEEDRIGGTGRVHDWETSRRSVLRIPKPVFLAGGLTPENVGRAVRRVRPYGVDVNTGVEIFGRKDGRKDAELLQRFIREALEALT